MNSSRRIAKIDNIRAILISCVVLGHLLETVNFAGKDYLYFSIYLFHMPAFAFVSGLCHKRMTGEKLLSKFFVPYLILQIIYVMFETKVMHNEFAMQFSMPFWILWYLVAMICWNVVTETIYMKNFQRMFGVLMALIIIALLAGYDDSIGFYLSISRVIVFLPFYYAGVLAMRWHHEGEKSDIRNGLAVRIASLVLVTISVCCVILKSDVINVIWFQSTTSYANGEYSVLIRLLFFIGAASWIGFMMANIPDFEIPVLTRIGKNTYVIFILHGFVIKTLSLVQWNNHLKVPLLACVVATVFITLALGYLSQGIKMVRTNFIHKRI